MASCRIRLIVPLTLAAALARSAALAQSTDTQSLTTQGRFFEEQTRPLIAPELLTPEVDQRLLYDYGVILRSQGFWFEDHGPNPLFPFPGAQEFQGSRSVFDFDVRPWLTASLDGVHFGFIRGQFDYLQYGSGDSYTRNSDFRGPFVDLGFYRLDLDAAAAQCGMPTSDTWSAELSVGRQFRYFGRGIAFALNVDSAAVDWRFGDFAGTIFGGQSIRHFDNIDRSVPGFTNSEREFYAAQLEYERLDHHKPYAFAVAQRDRSNERPNDPSQEYDYDSEYYGVGIIGEALFGEGESAVGLPNLQYFAEFILQRGKSYGVGATNFAGGDDPIRSQAFDFGVVHYFRQPYKSRAYLEYARANGDTNRFSPQNSTLGNLSGTVDHGFLSFGFLNTGVSFAPLFSNLEFVRTGVSALPFDGWEDSCWQQLEVGVNLFWYWRPDDDGGVSDLRADTPGDHYLGNEIDLFASWRFASDLYLIANYGVFWPEADSFTVERSRQLLGVNITWLF